MDDEPWVVFALARKKSKRLKDGGKRSTISAIERQLSRDFGGVWLHENDWRLARQQVIDREEWWRPRHDIRPEVRDSYFTDGGDFFYRLLEHGPQIPKSRNRVR